MRGVLRFAAAAAAATCALVLVPSVPASAAPGPPGHREWWFDTWDVPSLWAGGARGQGITIAEIDTGVNSSVPELAGKILDGQDFADPTTLGHRDHDLDEFGHGTAMASLMVAEPGFGDIAGLAPDARVLPIAVPLRETDIATSEAGSIADAVRFAADHGAKIISMSLGDNRDPGQDSVPCPVDTQDAISYAVSKGLIVVAASGNDGETGSPVTEPGVCIGVVAVGAVDVNDAVASFSSRHPYLTMTAPGANIPTLSRIPGEAYIGEGTSQATAITSAALALVWSKFPAATNTQIVARALATVDHKASGAPDPGYGYGIVNPAAAINTAVPDTAPNPLYDALTPFLQHEQAKLAVKMTPPPPITTTDAPPGDVVVGARPSVITTPVLAGAGLGAAGVVALIALVIVGVRGRRRYATAGVAPAGEPYAMSPDPIWTTPATPPPPAPDPVRPDPAPISDDQATGGPPA